MKKLALALCLVLAMGSVSSAATVTFGEMKMVGSQQWLNGAATGVSPGDTSYIAISTKASGTGWSAEAELGSLVGTPKLSKWSATATDGKLTVTAWGREREKSDKGTPFGFVKSVKKATNWKVRAEYKADYAPITVDLETGNDNQTKIYAFSEKTFDPVTVGIGIMDQPQRQQATASVYAKGSIAPVDLTGEVAIKAFEKNDNLAYGVQAVAKLPASITATAKYTSEAKNWANKNTLYLEGKQDTTGLLELKGSYETRARNADNADLGDTIKASVKARGDGGNQKYDDQFKTDKDQYTKNVSWGAMGEYVINTANASDKATNTLTIKGTTPVIAGKAWVLASLVNTRDQDGVGAPGAPLGGALNWGSASAKNEIDVYGRYVLTDKVFFDGELFNRAYNSINHNRAGVKATYKMAGNNIEYWAKIEADHVRGAAVTGLPANKARKTGSEKLSLGFTVKW